MNYDINIGDIVEPNSSAGSFYKKGLILSVTNIIPDAGFMGEYKVKTYVISNPLGAPYFNEWGITRLRKITNAVPNVSVNTIADVVNI